MIRINDVSKGIGCIPILKSVSLDIVPGSILALIGPNGAGKTSLIKTMTGIWKADAGSVTYNGEEVFENIRVKEQIGYVPDQSHYYDSYRIGEIIEFYSLAYKGFDKNRFGEVNDIFKLDVRKRVSELSKGNKTKLSLILNLSIMPKYLILDEPSSGLDPIAKSKLNEMLIDDVASRGTTILMSTHNLAGIEKICDTVAFMDRGEIKYSGSIDDIKSKVRKLEVVFLDEIPIDVLESTEVVDVKTIGDVYQITTKDYTEKFAERLKASGVSHMEEIDLNLEEIFVNYFGGEVYENAK